MSQCLPQHLLQLFQPREPVPYLPPVSKLPYERGEHYEKNTTRAKYGGIGRWAHLFEQAKDTPTAAPAPVRTETREERRERKQKEREEALQYKLERDLAMWNPNENSSGKLTEDPLRTLFVSRLNYETTESKLKREFEKYGAIETVRMVHDANTGKSRGYAFVQYEDVKSMHRAYKDADGTKIDGHRLVVDYERGRTVSNFKPHRLGGTEGGRKARAKGENPHKKAQPSSTPHANGEVRSDRGASRDDREQSSRDRERDSRGGRSYADNRRDQDRNGGGGDYNRSDRGGRFDDDRKSFAKDNGRSSGHRPIEFAPPPPRGGFGNHTNALDKRSAGDDRKLFDSRERERSKRSRSGESVATIGGRYSSRDERQGSRASGYGDGASSGGGGYRDRDRRRAW